MTREDFNIGWKVVYGIVAVADVIVYFQAKEFWLSYLGFITFLLVILPLIYLLITEDREGFGFYLGILLCIVICWIFSFGVIFTEEAFNSDAQNYILSSISQGLAALFAFVFTISLVAAQMFSDYLVRGLRRLFSKRITAFMAFFSFGIIYPLIIMKTGSELGLNTSLGIAGTCIILVIPYFLHFKNLIVPEILLDSLAKKAINETKGMDKIPYQLDSIDDIDDIIMTAYYNKKYHIFKEGLWRLLDIFIKVDNIRLVFRYEFLFNKYYTISSNDKIGKEWILDRLRRAGEKSIQKGSKQTNLMICNLLLDFGREEAKGGNDDLAQYITLILSQIGMRSTSEKKSFGIENSIDKLKELYIWSILLDKINTQYYVMKYLGFIGINIIQNKLDLKYFIQAFKQIGLEKIKNRENREVHFSDMINELRLLIFEMDAEYKSSIIEIGKMIYDFLIQISKLTPEHHYSDIMDLYNFMVEVCKISKGKNIDIILEYQGYLEETISRTDDDGIKEIMNETLNKIKGQDLDNLI